MKVCVIGTGYVGLVSGACLSDVGHQVICVDINEEKVTKLNNGCIPIYEPGLEDIVKRNHSNGRLSFTTQLSEGVVDADVCFITVDTPPGGDGKADLSSVLAVAKSLGESIDHPMVVVTKSTVPVGTTMKVKSVICDLLESRGLDPKEYVHVANNPEFLKEGDAVSDFMKPDRIVVGVEDDYVGEKMHALYAPFMRRKDRFILVNIPSSEMIKYAANAMLATRISFVNEIARLCEKVGADINNVRQGLGSDPRIGPEFLYAGLGYGGSCFPKDTKAIIELGKEHDTHLSVIEAADQTNDYQREWFWAKVQSYFGVNGLATKKIAIWGTAFKANTDDVRFAPALTLIDRLLENDAIVSAYDPVAVESTCKDLGVKANQIHWAANAMDALKNADALIVCTEWLEFRSPDIDTMKSLMNQSVIFDGRNLYDCATMSKNGFTYFSVGR